MSTSFIAEPGVLLSGHAVQAYYDLAGYNQFDSDTREELRMPENYVLVWQIGTWKMGWPAGFGVINPTTSWADGRFFGAFCLKASVERRLGHPMLRVSNGVWFVEPPGRCVLIKYDDDAVRGFTEHDLLAAALMEAVAILPDLP